MNQSDLEQIRRCAEAALAASRQLAVLDPERRNGALVAIAAELEKRRASILAANAKDVGNAVEQGLAGALIDRLRLDDARLIDMVRALREIIALPDPLGAPEWQTPRADGLEIGRMRVPLGVIAMIYEARPNVTIDAAALCLKSGNTCVLRGGSEARHSNAALIEAVQAGLAGSSIMSGAVALMPVPGREAIAELLKHDDCLALVIPRGGEGLVRHVAAVSRVPVIRHYKGVCHLFVERQADFDQALALLIDGKCSRPSACNALETMLVDAPVAATFLPLAAAALSARNITMRGDSTALPLLPNAEPADASDWDAEYLGPTLAIAVVDGLDQALAHIARHGSLHTEAIATTDAAVAERFLREVDASAVMVNASTRFNDGGELGLGAEIGISTSKLHAYGPMGLESLTTRKWLVRGRGHTRAPLR